MTISINYDLKTKVKRIIADDTTIVRTVKLGTPVKKVDANITFQSLSGINTTGAVEGSILIYDSSSSDFIAKTVLEAQTISGGQY